MSAPTKYVPRIAPSTYQRAFISDESQRVAISLDSLIVLLAAINAPVEIGAPNSGGAGYRMLRIPN